MPNLDLGLFLQLRFVVSETVDDALLFMWHAKKPFVLKWQNLCKYFSKLTYGSLNGKTGKKIVLQMEKMDPIFAVLG